MSKTHDLYYAAGLLEGEGSFVLRTQIHPGVSMSQADLEPLETLQRLFGGHIYAVKPNKLSKKPLWVWNLNASKGIALMMSIYPLMTQKRQAQIRRAIAGWRSTKHVRINIPDDESLAMMRRVFAGEKVYKVAQEACVHEYTLRNWLSGRKRPELLVQLREEGVIAAEVFDAFEARRMKYAGKHYGEKKTHHKIQFSDEDALNAMRAVQSGQGSYRVAKERGIKYNVLQDWLSGLNRPYLLAQLQEASPVKEVPYD